jgi:HD-GYP domain-containing protein (c-di-GMP phosphodiesterase class II)
MSGDWLTPSEKAVVAMAKKQGWPYALLRADGGYLKGAPGTSFWRKKLVELRPKRAAGTLAVKWPKGTRGTVFPVSGQRWLLVGPFPSKGKSPDPEMLALAADLAGNSLVLTEALFQKMHALEAVLHLGSKFATIKDLEQLVSSSIVHEVVQLLNADRGTVYLLSDDGREIYSMVALGMEMREIRFPVERGIAGYVARTGKVVNIPDAYQDERFNPDFDKKTGYRTRSVLAAPMTDAQGNRVGVVQVINKKDGTAFTHEDEEFLQTIGAEAATAIINVKLVEEQKQLAESMIVSLAAALDARDTYTAGHSHRVALYAHGIARHMGIKRPQLDHIRMAGLMHDLGKIGVPDIILRKTGGLTGEEYEIIKKHASFTRTILREIKLPSELHGLPEEAGGHHERMDGSGYPDNLPGDKIPLTARILAVADVFDAITSRRTYRSAMPIEDALKVIKDGSGRHFYPDCVAAFLRYFEAELRAKWPADGGGDNIPQATQPQNN